VNITKNKAMKNFKELPSNPCNGGIQYIYKAENGYGASIVQHQWSYGGNNGLWEIAVLGPNGDICYSTPITSDVIGYLTDEEVNELLAEIDTL
jgi:hypothetical protein